MTEREAWEILGERYRKKTNRHAGICLEACYFPDDICKWIMSVVKKSTPVCDPSSTEFKLGYSLPIADTESRAAFCFARAEELKQQGL